MMSEISVLLPEPLDPTSAVVVPAGAWNETPLSTGTPALYSNSTCSNRTSPSSSGNEARDASSWSSVAICFNSRMRSRPANASLICVPIDAIDTTGATVIAVKNRYMMKSPSVISPDRIDWPPTRIMTTPTTPTMTVAPAVVAEMPVIVLRTLSNRR